MDEWHVAARILAGLALLAAVLLGVAAVAAADLGPTLPPKRSLVAGAAAALGVGVVLLAILLVASTIDTLGRNDF